MSPDIITGALLLVAGVLGIAPIDARAAWALVLLAGLLMIVL